MDKIIEVEKLVKDFGEIHAVRGISFSVERGEIFGFLGPNGAGKTTTIKMLTTLLHSTSGKMLVNGYDPMIQMNEVRASFGIVFQDPSLDNELTAYENLEFHGILYGVPADVRKKRIQELLHFVELWDRKDDFVKNFSGGMKRRLEIARGLIHHPKILFLDEPTLGLDPQTRNSMWGYVRKLNKEEGMTIFFTTHYMDEAERNATRIAIVDHGKIIKMSSASELAKMTKTKSLEEAFLKLTGHAIREEGAKAIDTMRANRRMWGR